MRIIVRGDRLFSDVQLPGFSRWTWLCPLPAPQSLRPTLHGVGRCLRAWWPLWWLYRVDGRASTTLVGRGDRLIQRELSWEG